MTTLGILGFGVMGEAFAQGVAAAGGEYRIVAADPDPKRRTVAEKQGIPCGADAGELAKNADILLFAVKPQYLRGVLTDLKAEVAGKSVISIAAGIPIELFAEEIDTVNVARLMPNIAATRNMAFVGASFHPRASKGFREQALRIASSVGTCVEVPQGMLAGITGLCGSGIAFVFAFVHAMAMGGVHAGLSYDKALPMTVQTIRGALALLEDGEASPMQLLTRVTSPAGTTIEGIEALEQGGFAAAVMHAVKRAADRAVELEG